MKNTVLAGRYTLLELIGRGGEAQVWRARDEQRERDVAVRLPLQPSFTPAPPFTPPTPHPGWVRCRETGHDPLRGAYQILDLILGETLAEIVARQALPRASWLTFLEQSLAAVAALHRAGWVHGDLQAANFLREKETARWVLLELPFLAFPPAPRSPLFGSLPVLAPELFCGHAPSFRTDLYALGILYYYALSGAYPHRGSAVEIAAAHLHEPMPSFQTGEPRIPPLLEEGLQRLLARDPGNRFPNAAAAHDVLRGCCTGLG